MARTLAPKKFTDQKKKQRKKKQAKKKVDKVLEDKESLLTTDELGLVDKRTAKKVTTKKPVWIPDYDPDLDIEANIEQVSKNPGIQARFLASDEDEVLFTGGRGSGKSDCLIVDPLPYCSNKNFRGLVLRNTMKELRELIKRARELYPQVYEGVQWKVQDSMFIFPSGATIEYGYCNTEEDIDKYKGQEYQWIGVDELTKFPWPDFVDQLKGSLRSTDPALKCYFRASTNADGIGKLWVKERYVDVAPAEVTIKKEFNTPIGTVVVTSKWFHSTPFDNKILVKNNPNYIATLHNISNEVLRKQWIDNDWNVSSTAGFPEFDEKIHVINPFTIPYSWPRIQALDWGYKQPAACIWGAISPTGILYIYREYVISGRPPDLFQQDINEKIQRENIHSQLLDGSAWRDSGQLGETVADTLIRYGGRWIPADRSKGSRKSGKILMHQLLNIDEETGKPNIFVFNTCPNLIKELQSLQTDPNDPEDVDTSKKSTLPDHCWDALRYLLLSRPPIKRTSWDYSHDPMADAMRDPVSISFGY